MKIELKKMFLTKELICLKIEIRNGTKPCLSTDKIDFESTILALFDSATLLNLQKKQKNVQKSN